MHTIITINSLTLCKLHLHFCTQTLTTLYLSDNQIEAVGAQHLADALRNNTVIIIFIYLIYTSPLFYADTHRTKSSEQLFRMRTLRSHERTH
jgi:hypothetical protein